MATFIEQKVWEVEECERIVEMAKDHSWSKGLASMDNIRKCINTEMSLPEVIDPVYEFVRDNNEWGFDIIPSPVSVQVLNYDVGGFYKRHTDWSHKAHPLRKISVSIQLSDHEDYDGCELVLHDGPGSWTAHKGQGMGIMFPSWTLHEVTECLSGERWVAVAWFAGSESYK